MHATRSSFNHQRRRVGAYRTSGDSHSFFNLLTSDALLGQVEELLPEHRERLYPPTETLSLFLTQALNADRSCQPIVNQAAIGRLAGGRSVGSISTGGYCRARQRLPLTMASNLTQYLGDLIDPQVPLTWRWQGRRVRIVDGTTVTMPDTAQNQAAFPNKVDRNPAWAFRFVALSGSPAFPAEHY